jgi:hypothetical protein
LTVILALGVRAEKKSVEAMRAATTKQTVVKKPKTFWARVIVECCEDEAMTCGTAEKKKLRMERRNERV